MGIPVKVFRSTDPDAPQISGGRGDFKTILKACLCTGFGSKEPLGWEIVPGTETTDGYDCAFRSTAIDSAKNIVLIKCPTATTANATAYFDTDTNGALIDASVTMADFPVHASAGVEWALIGHSKSFIVIIKNKGSNGGYLGGMSSGLFFGEISDRINNARANTLLFRLFGTGNSFASVSTAGIADLFAGNYSVISLKHDGLAKWQKVILYSSFPNFIENYSPINSELLYSQVALTENQAFRGYLPFGYHVPHKLIGTENYKNKTFDGVNYLLCNFCNTNYSVSTLASTSFLLIKLDEWDV